jgi:hypothetical protein
MVTIKYCAEGDAVSDFYLDNWLEDVMIAVADVGNTLWERNFEVSTSLPIYIIKREVAKGNISMDDIQFKYDDKIIRVNRYGAIIDWPRGFADKEVDYCEDTLKLAMKMRQAERTK